MRNKAEEAFADLYSDRRQSLKRMAVQVLALLPEDEHEALCVLTYAHSFLVNFLREHRPEPTAETGQVIAIRANGSAS